LQFTRGKMILLAIVLVLAVYATWPGDNSLDYSSCEPKSELSKLSATIIYGRFFWERQLTLAHDLAVSLEDLNESRKKMLADARAHKEQTRQIIEDIYAKQPDMAPTAGARAAQALRERADQIEEQELLDHFSHIEGPMIIEVRHCEQVIREKLRHM
jgi:hypothetical protein